MAKTVDQQPRRPTCSSFLSTAWAANAASAEILDLNPFDSAPTRLKEENLITHCIAFPKTLSSSQDRTTTVECSDCPYGYADTMSSLVCRPSPACDKSGPEGCTRCEFDPQTPSIIVPCTTCISKQCNMNGNCGCSW